MKLPQLYDIFREKWEKYQSIFLISDTHFDDEELAAAGLNPLRRDSEEYLKVINSKIGKRDMMIHLGDVGNLDYIRRCRAEHKVLICGNHDAGASNYKREITQEMYNASEYKKADVIADMRKKFPNYSINVSEPIYDGMGSVYYVAFADNRLFDEVYTGPLIIGEKLILSHEPVDTPWAANIHGHCHSPNHKDGPNQYNICPDATRDFNPVPLAQILKHSGFLSHVQSLHRDTINNATKRARKRGKKNEWNQYD